VPVERRRSASFTAITLPDMRPVVGDDAGSGSRSSSISDIKSIYKSAPGSLCDSSLSDDESEFSFTTAASTPSRMPHSRASSVGSMSSVASLSSVSTASLAPSLSHGMASNTGSVSSRRTSIQSLTTLSGAGAPTLNPQNSKTAAIAHTFLKDVAKALGTQTLSGLVNYAMGDPDHDLCDVGARDAYVALASAMVGFSTAASLIDITAALGARAGLSCDLSCGSGIMTRETAFHCVKFLTAGVAGGACAAASVAGHNLIRTHAGAAAIFETVIAGVLGPMVDQLTMPWADRRDFRDALIPHCVALLPRFLEAGIEMWGKMPEDLSIEQNSGIKLGFEVFAAFAHALMLFGDNLGVHKPAEPRGGIKALVGDIVKNTPYAVSCGAMAVRIEEKLATTSGSSNSGLLMSHHTRTAAAGLPKIIENMGPTLSQMEAGCHLRRRAVPRMPSQP
jgi:hypothetical protein